MAPSAEHDLRGDDDILNCYNDLREIIQPDLLRDLGFLLQRKRFHPPTDDELASAGFSPSLREFVFGKLDHLPGALGLFVLSVLLRGIPTGPTHSPIEICWTGPQPKSLGNARATEAALEELIQSAEDSVMVAGYRVGGGAESVLQLLARKANEGVALTFLLDRGAVSDAFFAWARGLAPAVDIYIRPEMKGDPMSALHAKCVIVDGRRGLFGSANLTFHGMKGNVEMGIIVRDAEVVQRAVALLQELKAQLVHQQL